MRIRISTILVISLALFSLGTVSADSAYPLNWGDYDQPADENNGSYPPNDAATAGDVADVPALPVVGLMILGGSLAGLAVRKMREI